MEKYNLNTFLSKSKDGNLIKYEDFREEIESILDFLDGMTLNANLESDVNTISIIKDRIEPLIKE